MYLRYVKVLIWLYHFILSIIDASIDILIHYILHDYVLQIWQVIVGELLNKPTVVEVH